MTVTQNGNTKGTPLRQRPAGSVQDIAESAPKIKGLEIWALDRWLDKFQWLQRSTKTQRRPDPGMKLPLRPVALATSHVQNVAKNNAHTCKEFGLTLPDRRAGKAPEALSPPPLAPAEDMVRSAGPSISQPGDSRAVREATQILERNHMPDNTEEDLGQDVTGLSTSRSPQANHVLDERSLTAPITRGGQESVSEIGASPSTSVEETSRIESSVAQGKRPEVDPVLTVFPTQLNGSVGKDVLIRLSKTERVKQLQLAPTLKALAKDIKMFPQSIQRLADFAAFLGCSVESQLNIFGRELPPDLVPSFVQIDELALGISSHRSVNYICICGWTTNDEVSNFHRVMSKRENRYLYAPWKLCFEMCPVKYLAAHGLADTTYTYKLNVRTPPEVGDTLCGSTLSTSLSAMEAVDAGMDSLDSWYSTIGGLIEVDSIRYAITTAHRPRRSRPGRTAASSPTMSTQQTCVDEGDLDDSVGPALVLVTDATLNDSKFVGTSTSKTGTNGSESREPQNWPPLTMVANKSVIEGNDWRILPITAEMQLPNRILSDSDLDGYIFGNVTELPWDFAYMPTRTELISGRISPNPSFLVSREAGIQKIWTMHIDENDQNSLSYGDSGSWVFTSPKPCDTLTPLGTVTLRGTVTPCGTAIASAGSRVIITSLASQFEQIKAALGATNVQLPSPALCLLDLARYYATTDKALSEAYMDEAWRQCNRVRAQPLGFIEDLIQQRPDWGRLWPGLEAIMTKHGSELVRVLDNLTETTPSSSSFAPSPSEAELYRELANLLKLYRIWLAKADQVHVSEMPSPPNRAMGPKESRPIDLAPDPINFAEAHLEDLRRQVTRKAKTPVFRRAEYAQLIAVYLFTGWLGGTTAAIVWRTLVRDAICTDASRDAAGCVEVVPSLSWLVARGMVVGLVSSGLCSLSLLLLYYWSTVRGHTKSGTYFAASFVVMIILSFSRSLFTSWYLQSQSEIPYTGTLGFVAATAPLLISTLSPFFLMVISLSIHMWIPEPSYRTALDRMVLAIQKHPIKLGMFLATNRWWPLRSVDLELPTNTNDEARTVREIQETTQTAILVFIWVLQVGFDCLAGYIFSRVAQISGYIPPDSTAYFAAAPAVAAMAIFSAVGGLWFPVSLLLLSSRLSARRVYAQFSSVQRCTSYPGTGRFGHRIDLIISPERRIVLDNPGDTEMQAGNVWNPTLGSDPWSAAVRARLYQLSSHIPPMRMRVLLPRHDPRRRMVRVTLGIGKLPKSQPTSSLRFRQ